jgi:hypothetical protein
MKNCLESRSEYYLIALRQSRAKLKTKQRQMHVWNFKLWTHNYFIKRDKADDIAKTVLWQIESHFDNYDK